MYMSTKESIKTLSLTDRQIIESPDYMFSDYVADMLGKDIRTVYRWRKQGKLIPKYLNRNGRPVYTREQIMLFTRLIESEYATY